MSSISKGKGGNSRLVASPVSPMDRRRDIFWVNCNQNQTWCYLLTCVSRLYYKQEGHDGPVALTWGCWIKETLVLTGRVKKKFKRSMCGPFNTTAVNGYMNQDSHAVSWCILFFFLYLKRRLDKGYFRDLYECKTGSQPFCCSCFILMLMGVFNQNTKLYFWRRHTRQLPIKVHWILFEICSSRWEVLTAN